MVPKRLEWFLTLNDPDFQEYFVICANRSVKLGYRVIAFGESEFDGPAAIEMALDSELRLVGLAWQLANGRPQICRFELVSQMR